MVVVDDEEVDTEVELELELGDEVKLVVAEVEGELELELVVVITGDTGGEVVEELEDVVLWIVLVEVEVDVWVEEGVCVEVGGSEVVVG